MTEKVREASPLTGFVLALLLGPLAAPSRGGGVMLAARRVVPLARGGGDPDGAVVPDVALARFDKRIQVVTSHSLARGRAWQMPLPVGSDLPKGVFWC